MARRFLTNITLEQNELQNARIQNLATAPSNPVAGQIYFATNLEALRFYDGNDWVDVMSMEGTITSVQGTAPIQTSGTTSVTISIDPADGSSAGSMSAAHYTKLEGIEAGATQNETDAFLLDRANHTGSQAISTITNLQTTLDDKLEASDIADFETSTELDSRDAANRDRTNHTGSQAISTVTGLQDTLDDKLEAADIADFETTAQLNSRDTANRDRSNHTGTQAISTVSGLQDALDDKLETSLKGANDGLAELDSGGKVPSAQLPSIAITNTTVVADIAARDALSPDEGDIAVVQDRGDGEPATYIYDGTDWQKLLSPTKGVTEVTGGTGITSSGGDTPEISITDGGVGTDQLADEAVTEDKLSTDVQNKLNTPETNKHAETIGDGTDTDFTITHNFDTRDVQVSVYEASSPYAQVEATIEHTTVNTVEVKFAVAPSSSEFRVVVIG